MNGSRATKHACFLLILACLIYPQVAASVESFEVRQESDTAFLPYRLTTSQKISMKPDARKTNAAALLLRPRYSDTSKALVLGMNLAKFWEDQTINIDVLSFPPTKLELQAAVRMTPVRWSVYVDSTSGVATAIVTGFHGDSAYVLEYDPATAAYQRRCLQIGEDGTGTGRWEPEIVIVLIDDYDYDGRTEAFIHVKPVRDKGVRTLYCVELGSLEVEWSCPIALGFYQRRNVYRLPDTSNPGIIFLAKGSRQGHVDDHYNELFGYVSIIDSSGQVRFNRIVQYAPVGPRAVANSEHTRFYFTHEFYPVDPAYEDSLTQQVENGTIGDGLTRVSVMDTSGTILHTTEFIEYPENLWLMSWRGSREPCLYVYGSDRVLRVFDSTLTLLAESTSCESRLGDYFGPISLEKHPNALLFGEGIYTRDFEQIARFDYPCTPTPLGYDTSGFVRELFIVGQYQATFNTIQWRGWQDVATILYFRYRMYIMVILTALLVGLVVVNFYRARTRRNLIIIQQQKEQLERAQEALRRAQAQLVAQEKFRQARDIAGGFAHEIRNALSPIRNALTRLTKISPEKTNDDQFARLRGLIDRSVTHAVELTQRISEYAHLEEPKKGGRVAVASAINRAVERHRDTMNDRRVTLIEPEDCPGVVFGDLPQYELVFSNLISNAVDAVADVDDPQIEITCRNESENVVIEIADNGVGIDPDDIERVFDFFYSTKPDAGTGVGLAIVKKTVEMYGGSISVQSEPDRGATFRVTLPVSAT